MTDRSSNTASKPPSLFNSSPYHATLFNKENHFPSGRRSSQGTASISEDILKNKIQNLTHSTTQRRGSTPFAHEMSFNPENTLKNSRNESPEPLREKLDNISQSDIKLLHKEISTLKKALNESQARSVVATKDLAKIQYENAALQLQVKKADAKCKDLIEKHATNQVRINELTFINNQLNNEIAKLKVDAQENSHDAKEDLNRLKRTLVQIEDTIQAKNNKVAQYSRETQKILDTLQGLLEGANMNIYSKFQASFMQSKKFIQKILKAIDSRNVEDFDTTQEENLKEYDAIKSLNEVIYAYEKENGELANEVNRLQTIIEKEKDGSHRVPSNYKESLYKLKDAVNVVKIKLKEMQKNKQVEKEYYEGKMQKLKEARDRLVQENKSLKSQNQMLESKLRDNEHEIKTLKEKIEGANLKHHQGIKAPLNRATNNLEKKNEAEYIPYRKSSAHKVDVPIEKEMGTASKMYIDGDTDDNYRSARGYLIDRRHKLEADTNQFRPQHLNFGSNPISNANKVNPIRSWREYKGRGDLDRNNQENSGEFEMGDQIKGEDIEGDNRAYYEGSDQGIRDEIFLLDNEIFKLEECIRGELATNEDFAF